MLVNLRQVEALGGRFHEDRACFTDDCDRPGNDEGSDEHTGDCVCAGPAGQGDDGGGGNDCDRTEGIVDDLEESGAHIEVRAAPTRKDKD